MEVTEPELQFVFEARVEISDTAHIGRGDDEELRFTPIVGGTVNGPRLSGTIVPGGGDWSVRRGGTTQLEARYLLRADDGALIDILNRGYHRRADHTDSTLISPYYRTSPVFQTDHPDHRWLAEHQFIGYARRDADVVCIRFYLVL